MTLGDALTASKLAPAQIERNISSDPQQGTGSEDISLNMKHNISCFVPDWLKLTSKSSVELRAANIAGKYRCLHHGAGC